MLSKFPKVNPAYKWQSSCSNTGDQFLQPILLSPLLARLLLCFLSISVSQIMAIPLSYPHLSHPHLFILERVTRWRSRLSKGELHGGVLLPLKVMGISLSLHSPGQTLWWPYDFCLYFKRTYGNMG